MKLVALSLLLFAGFIAATYGDLACLSAQVQVCVGKLQTEITNEATFETICSKMDELDKCMQAALKTCNEQSNSDFTDFSKALKDLCTADSDLNKKYQKNKDCLNSYAETKLVTSKCVEDLQKVIKEFPTDATPEKIKEYANKLCGALKAMPTCLYSEVESACNKDAREVVEAVLRPYFKIATKNCDSIGGGAGTSALSWALLAAASLLFVLWH